MIGAGPRNVAPYDTGAGAGQVGRSAQKKIREAIESHASYIQARKIPIPDITAVLEAGTNRLLSARQRDLVGKLILMGSVTREVEVVRPCK